MKGALPSQKLDETVNLALGVTWNDSHTKQADITQFISNLRSA
jgi:hypothetical protein